MAEDGFAPWVLQWQPDRMPLHGRSRCRGTLTLRNGGQRFRVRWWRDSREPDNVIIRVPGSAKIALSPALLPGECLDGGSQAEAVLALGVHKLYLLGDREGVVIKLQSANDQDVYTLVGVPWDCNQRVRPKMGVKVKQQHALARRARKAHPGSSPAKWVPC